MTELAAPKVWINSATFSDGTTLEFGETDIVVFVGPNNAGKSAALRDIRSKLKDDQGESFVVKNLRFSVEGTRDDVHSWLKAKFTIKKNFLGDLDYNGLDAIVSFSEVDRCWHQDSTKLDSLTDFLCYHITADARLQAAEPVDNIEFLETPQKHPIHSLYQSSDLEHRASNYFQQAFKQELLVYRSGGTKIPLFVGNRPAFFEGEGEFNVSYNAKVAALSQLKDQGDGMRSFVGVLLFSLISHYPIVLLDEPEAFLHPPQARLLGRMLAKELKDKRERQLFLATHSGDVLRGLLDAGSSNVRVVRLQRDRGINRVSELSNEDLLRLWGDPALRYSNVLDGVFHEHVVVCEGDSDCRFYNALLDAIYEGQPEKTLPDVMFMHGGGKHAIPALVKSLRALNVPVTVVADFDILNDSNPLRPVYESLGGSWNEIKEVWNRVKKAIEGSKPQLSSREVKSEIEKALEGVSDPTLPKEAASKIREVLKVSSPWANAKKAGKAFVPSGDATKNYMSLNEGLKEHRCFIVEVGELEGFVKSIGGSNKPEWLNEVLKKNLREDPELEDARKFVRNIFAPLEI